MADHTQLTRWLVQNQQAVDLNIREFNWSNHWKNKIFDFEVSLTLNGQVSRGRGTDKIENLALEKACAEAIERAICRRANISTTGVAVHTNRELAIAISRMEATERALFNWHIENRVALAPIHSSQLEGSDVFNLRTDESTKIRFFKMAHVKGLANVVCLVEEGQQKFLGLATDVDQQNGIKRALFEAIRNLLVYRENPDQFSKSVHSNSDLWSADANYIDKFSSVFEPTEVPNRIFPEFTLKTHVLNKEALGLHRCPAIIARTIAVVGAA